MLATGDERFKEKMDLDIQVSKLRVLKQSYLSEHYDLEDRILKFYPQTIKEYEERIAGYESDTALAEQHKPQGEDKFCPMTIKGVTFTDKAAAGEMLLAVSKENALANPVESLRMPALRSAGRTAFASSTDTTTASTALMRDVTPFVTSCVCTAPRACPSM